MKKQAKRGLRSRIIKDLLDEDKGRSEGFKYRRDALSLLEGRKLESLANDELRDVVYALSCARGDLDDLFDWYEQELSHKFKKLIPNEKAFLQIFDGYSLTAGNRREIGIKGKEISYYLISIVKSHALREILFEKNLISSLSLEEKKEFMVLLMSDVKTLHQLQTRAGLVYEIMGWSKTEGLYNLATAEMVKLFQRIFTVPKFFAYFTKDNEARGKFSSGKNIVKNSSYVDNSFVLIIQGYLLAFLEYAAVSFTDWDMLYMFEYGNQNSKELAIRKMSLFAKSEKEFMRMIEIAPDNSHHMYHALESLRNIRSKN